jgi:mRNA interferase RelE/StbE
MFGSKVYKIHYEPAVVTKDLPRLSSTTKSFIKKAIEEKLVIEPIRLGKPLRHSLKGVRSLRVGIYRILYVVKSNETIHIIAISHRKDVY